MSNVEDKQRRLGKGLSALLPTRPNAPPTATAPATAPIPSKLPLDALEPNPSQPRGIFQSDSLQELAASIRAHGILQPLMVRKGGKGYQIIAGERRWRAAKLAGLTEVPVIIQEVADRELLEVALIENIQREDLNPIETAIAFDRLTKEFGLSQEEIGRRTGKDRVTISNLMRLLRLPSPVRRLIVENKLSLGHAKALLSLHGGDQQIKLANKATKQGMSVRQVERAAQVLLGEYVPLDTKVSKLDPNVRAAIDTLERALGTRVRIVSTGERAGRIEIDFYSADELDRLFSRITEGKPS
jgi:ParB family transcriptional regulator, chromosome partitioning protein